MVEKNSRLFTWTGVFLYNRLLWSAIGLLGLLTVWKSFPMSVEALTAQSSSKRANLQREHAKALEPRRSFTAVPLPQVRQVFGSGTSFAQFLSLTRIRISNIVHEVPFWGILLLMTALALNSGYFAGRIGGTNVWPLTYLMLQSVEGGVTLFFYIVATLYGAELNHDQGRNKLGIRPGYRGMGHEVT